MFQSKKCTDDARWSALYGLHKSGVGLMYQPCTCIGLAVLSIQRSLWVAGAFAVAAFFFQLRGSSEHLPKRQVHLAAAV